MSGSDPDDLCITDLSAIEAENFKYRNTQFLTDPDHVYEAGVDNRQAVRGVAAVLRKRRVPLSGGASVADLLVGQGRVQLLVFLNVGGHLLLGLPVHLTSYFVE